MYCVTFMRGEILVGVPAPNVLVLYAPLSPYKQLTQLLYFLSLVL